ncbi:hypothetical protein [Amycolatopsis thermophila]|uniref:Flagellar biosynthetic protein FliP n=1 Tax=Amycolatopsis thermophila TaxID=206084 RepID=A0ABU0EX45_9PSEU|nr:hypothetical protein [Amycolatopsis thermophila]MDQ0379889.1 hypothetical protein [Amycolatopsis thermophila]
MTALTWRSPATRRAVLHYLEMWIAMGLGMTVLGPLVRLGLTAIGWSAALDDTGWRALIMATEMALPMAGWMRFRGHGRRPIIEMTAWMYVPFALLLVPYWAGLITGGALMGVGHGLMGVAMAVVVYRHRH